MNRNTKTERYMDTSVLDGNCRENGKKPKLTLELPIYIYIYIYIYIMEIDENFAETVMDTMIR